MVHRVPSLYSEPVHSYVIRPQSCNAEEKLSNFVWFVFLESHWQIIDGVFTFQIGVHCGTPDGVSSAK